MATFEVLNKLMEISGSTELHKRMRFWFVQEIVKEEGLIKFHRDRCDDLRSKNSRRRVLIREMEALGECGVAVDSLKSLKQTRDREIAKLAALTYAIAESLAAIHEKESHVAKLDLNDQAFIGPVMDDNCRPKFFTLTMLAHSKRLDYICDLVKP
nr:hypothetical protein [Tanacetum cinerariifolium]